MHRPLVLALAVFGFACSSRPFIFTDTSSSAAGSGGASSSVSVGLGGGAGAGGVTSSSASASTGTMCTTPCTKDDDCPSAGACTKSTCATGCCTTAPAPSSTACDDGDPCTDFDHCDGAGACLGTPSPVFYQYNGSASDGAFPPGSPLGYCLQTAHYCSTTGPLNVPPPAAGYSNGPSDPPGACSYNIQNFPQSDPIHWVEAFCKSCDGDCAANCP